MRVNSSEKSSFEFSEWLVSTLTVRLRVIVDRPPYSHTHPVTTHTFITEFANLLESVVLRNEQLLTAVIRLQADLSYKPRPQTSHAKS